MKCGLSSIWLCGTLALVGCGKSDNPVVPAGAADCTKFGEVGDSTCNKVCAVNNQDFCAASAVDPGCETLSPGAVVDVCGVVTPSPEQGGEVIDLERSENVEKFAGSGPPDLGCYLPAGYPEPPGTPQMATLQGIVEVFSNGCESDDVEIEVYTVVRDGSANDGMPDELVGTAQMTDSDCTVSGVPEANEDCIEPQLNNQRWECTYTYPNVPTETELLVLTKGSGWSDLYEYNVYVPNAEVDNGMFQKDIRALAKDDYTTIPQVAYGATMRAGNGAVGGEVHDCGNVRLVNAVVDVDQNAVKAGRKLTYFTDDEVKPLPAAGSRSTSTLGLYAAMDIPAGPVVVAAAGALSGELVGVGFFKARIFANSVTSVTFRGLRPFQLPAEQQ